MAQEKENDIELASVYAFPDEINDLVATGIISVVDGRNKTTGEKSQVFALINLSGVLISMAQKIVKLETDVAKLKGEVH